MRVFIAYVKYKVYLIFIISNNLNASAELGENDKVKTGSAENRNAELDWSHLM